MEFLDNREDAMKFYARYDIIAVVHSGRLREVGWTRGSYEYRSRCMYSLDMHTEKETTCGEAKVKMCE